MLFVSCCVHLLLGKCILQSTRTEGGRASLLLVNVEANGAGTTTYGMLVPKKYVDKISSLLLCTGRGSGMGGRAGLCSSVHSGLCSITMHDEWGVACMSCVVMLHRNSACMSPRIGGYRGGYFGRRQKGSDTLGGAGDQPDQYRTSAINIEEISFSTEHRKEATVFGGE